MNEGHAGFLGLERIATHIAEGLSFAEAFQLVRAGTVFTTHTPVPAGIDRFDRGLVERYLTSALLPGVDPADALALGVEPGADPSTSAFNMAVMGLRLAGRANGVSRLHGAVSRRMFSSLWPAFDPDDVPITSVTNGVHPATWTDPALVSLAEERLGTTDTAHADWASPDIDDESLWSARRRMRDSLVRDARERVTNAFLRQQPGGIPPAWLGRVLDPDVLTIGFARRVPTYKRLTLMLHDRDRLRRILLDSEHPVQLVIAGKSHPADDEGKRLIQELVHFASEPEVRERIVFLPDYDMGMARTLYPGCDVWLNNPLRPLEACGTSGMKAALNGALNLSILDGWWDEFYDGDNGWAIPSADSAADGAERDALEATALYDLIEHQIAPRFYDRGGDGLPERWLASIRHTLATLSPQLSADRMVTEYVQRLYRPAAASAHALAAHEYAAARTLAEWKQRVTAAWPRVSVQHVESTGLEAPPQVGDALRVTARVGLDGLQVGDVAVEAVYGRSGADDTLTDVRRVPLAPDGESGGVRTFTGVVPLEASGPFGYTVRVVPYHELLSSPAELGLVAVAG
jgi:starch phosphorylase